MRGPAARRAACLVAFVAGSLATSTARAQDAERDVKFEWDSAEKELRASLAFRDVVDAEIREKLKRGLPTTIVFTATVHKPGKDDPVATTAQTCRITYLLWDEYWRIEMTRPGGTRTERTLTVEGVLRRCAEARGLLVADAGQVAPGEALFLKAKVQVNPISKEVVDKIKRWVNRPSGTGTAGPSDALFSTFTGLFLQRVGDAEREVKLTTKVATPTVDKPKPEKKRS